jgi:hypothetical protein
MGNLTKNELDPRSPRRRNIVADKLDAALDQPLRAREKCRILVEGES